MRFVPVSPDLLPVTLAERLIQASDGRHPLRVCLDGPRCAELAELAATVRDRLTTSGRPAGVVAADWFYRDASLRLEYGHHDVESFYSGWLDQAALQREVLRPVKEVGCYLPSLRDPHTNRVTRATPISLASEGFLLVVGELLLGKGTGLRSDNPWFGLTSGAPTQDRSGLAGVGLDAASLRPLRHRRRPDRGCRPGAALRRPQDPGNRTRLLKPSKTSQDRRKVSYCTRLDPRDHSAQAHRGGL